MNDTTTASAATPPRRRRRKSRGGLIFTMVVILAGGGWYGWHMYKTGKQQEGGYFYATVTTGDIEDLVTSTGKLQPRDYVDVGAQVSGQIEKLYVEVGDVVQKGQVLAEIDATTAIAKVDSLKAQLLNAETNLQTQETNKEKAARDLKRQENLLIADATTLETVLNARTTFANAERSIISSKAQIEVQRANLRIEERNLGYTQIKAPIAGTVMKVSVKQGQTVNATQNVPIVMQIADLTTMTVQSEVSEADIGKLYVGSPLYFTTLSGNNRRWYSELKRIEPTAKEQNSVVLYNALFDVQNDGGDLRPQMTTQVYFVNAEAKQVLLVPMAALQQGQQISNELARKEREKNGAAAKPAGGPGGPGTGAGGPPGAAPKDAATAAAPSAGTPPAAAKAGAAPGAGAPAPAAPGAGATAGGEGNRLGGRPGNGQGNAAGGTRAGGGFNGGQGMTPEQMAQFRNRGGGQGGAGGAGRTGGFNGGQGMTPEQMAQFRNRGGGQGGPNGQGGSGGARQGGGFNGPRPGGSGAMAAGGNSGGSAGPRPVQQRRGTVMVKKADGTLEARPVVVGVTDRVLGQVISGLKEGEEVVVAKREKESAPSASTPRPNNNQNFNPGNRGGGGFGGGRPF